MSVLIPAGFAAAGVSCGIKNSGDLDLALIVADRPATAAAVFTTSRAAAAPVLVSRRHLAATAGVRAVVLNSGCANAGTGPAGLAAAEETAAQAAALLDCAHEEVLVCSTGPIGPPLPMGAVNDGIANAVTALGREVVASEAVARAILTTDTVPKQAAWKGKWFAAGGMAKGAGMCRPDMATMLAVITTDALVDRHRLDLALRDAVEETFHALNLDGCPSTNDTVIALASGASGNTPSASTLTDVFTALCRDLAVQMAADAEGATRLVRLRVTGAADDATARRLGRAAADSALVRASFFGGDPNWGRILGAIGATDIDFDPAGFGVAYQGVPVARGGEACDHDEASLLAAMAKGDLDIAVVVGEGPGTAEVLTVDLTPDYVRFNGERS